MNYYKKYYLSPNNGFLPTSPPLQSFRTASMRPLDDLAAAFSGILNANVFRKELLKLPELDMTVVEETDELERAQLLFACFAHGFVWEGGDSSGFLPENLVRPWLVVCQKLQRKPVLMYGSIVLQNWKLIDPNKELNLDNLSTLIQFHGGLDESWFFLITTKIEEIGSVLVNLALKLLKNNYQIVVEEQAAFLEEISATIKKINTCLFRLYEYCDPYIFYTRVRPYLTSFSEIEYRGSNNNSPRNYFGGSAAQSSTIQLIDVLLGIKHKNKHSGYYLKEMRNYMPVQHRDFLVEIEKNSPISSWTANNSQIKMLYNSCIEQTKEFRQLHLEIVAKYIMSQTAKKGPGQTGTGGTNPMVFLKAARKDTSDSLKE